MGLHGLVEPQSLDILCSMALFQQRTVNSLALVE
jgi:hypothetical protein